MIAEIRLFYIVDGRLIRLIKLQKMINGSLKGSSTSDLKYYREIGKIWEELRKKKKKKLTLRSSTSWA